MAGVDDRIVSMKFDNGAFEQKLGDTLKSLDKLKQSLDFANSTRGMNDLSAASKSFSMGNMASAVEGVSAKFLALSTIGITALASITSKAIDAGLQLVKSLSIAPVMDGFKEYETNMNSIQTILANTDSKGTTLENVNAALDELNQYADQTIYNFSEMTRNIGTFTAAGVDLDTSVQAIKGIANLAAISGSNSEQASTAMYQLSQAMASGTVKLMDWNSVVNAGMGGEVFQKALFESGKAAKTLADVPMGQTFDEWKDAGNTFRGSLESGWLTGEVLTNTLQGFTGDLTEAQILSLGYTQEQATEIMRLGKIGKAAATEVKTATQLMSTVKEAVGSGWSTSFRILIGDFNEAKVLFTNISNAIGGVVGASADARNELLQGWKDLGGRDLLIQGFTDVIKGLASVLGPIKDAFREIFPKATAQQLFDMTKRFAEFAKSLTIGSETADKLKRAFAGFFAAIEIGWTIFKAIIGVVGDLVGNLSGAGGGILDFAATTGDTLVALNEALVAGGGIRDFFARLGEVIQNPIKFIKEFKENIIELFQNFPGADGVEEVLGRLGERFSALAGLAETVGNAWGYLSDRFEGIRNVLSGVWDYISNWFSELGDKLAAIMKPSDFDGAVDVVGVGLLGGITIMLKRFLSGGINLDFGGIIEGITESFGALTGTLKAMQADLKAKALMKIAIAVGVLTVSIVALSLIDSAALAKALTAIAVGFGLLIGVMTLLDKLSLGTGALKLGGLAAGMILVATASVILSVAIKNLSGLGWEELAKGLIGIAVGLGLLVVATNLIAADTGGMIKAGIAMIGISIALLILSEAVKSFAEMSWTEMAKGLVGVAVGLGLITLAMNFMPSGMVTAGLGLVAISAGLLILSKAVEAFADISWADMAKGFIGIGVGLTIIAGAMRLMPPGMVVMAAGLLVLSVALNVMAKAIETMGSMKLGDLAKGIGALAAMLLILAVAMNAMNGTAAGAGALIVASAALVVLTGVLKVLSKMSIAEIVTGLAAIAGVMAVLGVSALLLTPVVPVLYSLAGAMALIGASFALFGVGAILVAKAFEIMAVAGKTGVTVLIDVIKLLIGALPEFVGAFILALVELATELLAAAPVLLKVVQALLLQILETVIEVVPQIVAALGVIITGFLTLVQEQVPLLIETGFVILTAILQGIRDNIAQLITVGVEILVNLVSGLVDNMFMIVDTVVTLITTFLSALAARAAEIVASGLALLVSLISGITDNLSKVTDAIAKLIITFLAEITISMARIIEAGVKMLVWLISGISDNLSKVVDAVAKLITTFINDIGARTKSIVDAGFKVLTDLLQGIGNNLVKVVETVGLVVTKFVTALGAEAQKFITAGADALVDFLQGVSDNIQKVADKGVDVVLKFLEGVANNANELARGAADILITFLNALAATIEQKAPEIREAGGRVAKAIVDGITSGLSASSAINAVVNKAKELATKALDAVKGFLGINSPSKKFMEIGGFMAQGMGVGLDKDTTAVNSAAGLAERMTEKLKDSLSYIPITIAGMDEFSPVITPVLDLTKVQMASRGLDNLLGVSAIVPEVSIDRARQISTTSEVAATGGDTPAYSGPTEVTFEQNIYSPTALSVNDIYRNTRSQIALAKEELSIA